MNSVVYPADRTDCVPNSYEMRLALDGECFLKAGGHREVDGLTLEQAYGVRNLRLVASGKKPDCMQHSTKAARGVGATAESEEIDLVPGLIGSHQELVGIRYIFGNAVAEGETDNFRPPFTNLSERGAGSHRSHTRMVVGDLTGIALHHLVKLDYIRIPNAKLVARAVTTNYDVLHMYLHSKERVPLVACLFSGWSDRCFAARRRADVHI